MIVAQVAKKKGCCSRELFTLVVRMGSIGSLAILFTFLMGVRNDAGATTYNELLKRAATEEKPVQVKTDEENPVLVSYEVGDTSDFYTQKDKSPFVDDESEWEDWETEGNKK